MYQVELTESYCPAQADEVVLEVTVGDALREAAHDRPDTLALIERLTLRVNEGQYSVIKNYSIVVRFWRER
jgi:hypothetical protein